jgi:hypothetical protein
MQRQASDSYTRLLAQWQARREVVNAYHRALRFLIAHNGDTPTQQRELLEKLGVALIALRQASDQLRRYEQERAAPDTQ